MPCSVADLGFKGPETAHVLGPHQNQSAKETEYKINKFFIICSKKGINDNHFDVRNNRSKNYIQVII